ncbi:MAG: YceI family protein [Bacteroidota bacterium]|nr:YceI family protein [Bacteroidota bacterium]
MNMIVIKLLLFLIPFSFTGDNSLKVKSSSVTFKIKNAGITVDGFFTGMETDIKFNPLKPEECNIKASVSSKSVNTGNTMRDEHLRKPEYFDAAAYPRIILQSTKIEKTGPISFTGTFKLTIKNVTKEIKIPFMFLKTADKTEIKGSFKINRINYTVGEDSFTMSDDVTINLLVNVTE